MQDNTKIYFWSPFTGKVGTVKNVINTAYSLVKFSKKKIFEITLINVFGEWNFAKNNLLKKKILIKDFYNINFFLNFKKEGFLRSRLSYVFIFLISFIPLLKILKKEKPKILIVHLLTTLPFILYSIFNFETKLILSIAGYPKLNFLRKFLWKQISNKIYKVICPSNELKDELIKYNIFEKQKIFVIQDPHLNIKDINELKNNKVNEEFQNDKKVLISIGRLTIQKNFKFLIKNFSKLLEKNNNLQLIIIGDGEKKKELLLQANELGLCDNIKFVGYKKNVYNYLKHSNYYISTSNWEGSSLSMIDAAYIGIPILCSDCPSGRKEFIDIDKRGYLYATNDDQDFIEKFNLMVNEEKNKIQLKLIEAKKETKKFTLFQYYKKFVEMID
tara:strand:+ start:1101 stop:2261 length:1161 start_codon:yes stop_codon:yes gene_type:complete